MSNNPKSNLREVVIQVDPKLVGQRLKSARTELGYTQSDLADMLGLKQSTISRAENGDLNITLNNLVRLVEILHKPAAYFLGIDTELSKDELELLSLYRALPHNMARHYSLVILRGLLSPLEADGR